MVREAHSHAFGRHHPEKATLMYWQALPPALSQLAVWQQMGRHPDSYKQATGSPGLVAARRKSHSGQRQQQKGAFFHNDEAFILARSAAGSKGGGRI